MRRATRVVLGGVAAAVLLGAGCTDRGESIRAEPDAPVELAALEAVGPTRSPYPASYGTGTDDGDDLVVIAPPRALPASSEAALRRRDGTWWQLPPVPFTGYMQLASAGGRAVVGGIACTDEACNDGELAFAMLAEDRSRWIPLDAPDIELSPTETELTTAPGPSAFAEFHVAATTYLVDQRGGVNTWSPTPTPAPPGTYETGCLVGDTYVTVHLDPGLPSETTGQPGVSRIVGDLYVQRAGAADPPVAVGPVPAGPTTRSYFCSDTEVIIDDGVSQASLDVASRRWQSGPSNLAQLMRSPLFISSISGRLATSPDGAVVFLQGDNNGVLRRTGPGVWESTGTFGDVFATGASVLVIGGDDDQTVAEVWPEPAEPNG